NMFCNFLPVSVIDYGTPITAGNIYTFRASAGGMVSPGNYQILAVAGSGGKDVRVGLASGVDKCAAPGQVYEVDTKTGVTAGAVRGLEHALRRLSNVAGEPSRHASGYEYQREH